MTRNLARRPPVTGRRGQARRAPTGPAAVLIVLVLGVSLLAIVIAQVILGSDRLGATAPPGVVERPAATLVVPNARPPRPVLETQGSDAALPVPPGAKPLTTAPALTDLVHRHLGEQRGVFGVAIKDLDGGQGVLVNADKELPAASLFKLPVMYEAYRQRDAGRLSFADTMTLTTDFARHDLGTLEVPVGSTVTVAWALDRMITRSDNAMANLLAEKVGWTNINNTMQQLGLRETRLSGDKLSTSARDMLHLFELIALGKGLNQASSTEMVQLLLDQRVRDRLPAQLPRDTPVAHKTGNLAGITHDAGIVYSPGATFVIVLLAAEVGDEGAVARAEAALARAVYDYFNPAGVTAPRSALRAPSVAGRPTPLLPVLPAGTPGTPGTASATAVAVPPPGAPAVAPAITPQRAPTAVAEATVGRAEPPTVQPTRAVVTAVRPTNTPASGSAAPAEPPAAPTRGPGGVAAGPAAGAESDEPARAITAVRPTAVSQPAPAPPPTEPARGPIPPTAAPVATTAPAVAPTAARPAPPPTVAAPPSPTAGRLPEAPRFGAPTPAAP